jgi:NAD(P)-dependent dehydrogenase (short-subunit alcohol dehydrogenase family)
MRFVNKTVLVIGGNSGIGLMSAKLFASEGARVLIAGRNSESLQTSLKEIGNGAKAHRVDISSLKEIDSLFFNIRADTGMVDVMFLSAGALGYHSIESVTETDWDLIQSVNLKGTFFCIQRALPLMSKGSSIVLTGSTAGSQACPTAPAYAASKAGIRSLGRSLAAALLAREIRVNVVSPGPTDTQMFHRAAGLSPGSVQSQRENEIDGVPMKRMGTPEEIAAAVLFLASDSASFITGVELLVAGGAGSF